jgi:hypothetical protein
MVSSRSVFTDEATSEPEGLRIYLRYRRLRSRDLGQLYLGLGRLHDQSVLAMSGHRYFVFVRGDELFRVKPSLDVVESYTGNSIKLRFAEGWSPTLTTKEGDFEVGVPKIAVIPLLVGYLLIQGATQCLDMHNKYLDGREKQLQIQLDQIELRLKEDEVQSRRRIEELTNNEKLQHHSIQVVKPILSNDLITSCQINDIEIKPH